jgi:hypothetical protein
MVFVVKKVATKQVFSEDFGSLANLHSTKFSILTITHGRYYTPDVADVPSARYGLHPSLCEFKKKKKTFLVKAVALMLFVFKKLVTVISVIYGPIC